MNQNPSGPWLIRKLHGDELDNAFALIWRVFKKFVAPDYTDEGITFFYKQFITGQDFRNNFLNSLQIMYGSFDHDKLVGVLSISKNYHISCVFVDENYHRKGGRNGTFQDSDLRIKAA